jgi:hypothetical protein
MAEKSDAPDEAQAAWIRNRTMELRASAAGLRHRLPFTQAWRQAAREAEKKSFG